MTRATFALLLPVLLACSGVVDAALERANDNPEFRQSFAKSFGESFTRSCTDAAVEGGTDPATASGLCACTANQLMASRTPSELFDLMSEVDTPAGEAAVKEAMAMCAATP
jgi:hypothetical protein